MMHSRFWLFAPVAIASLFCGSIYLYADNDCGGIQGGEVYKNRSWAHWDRLNQAASQPITLSLSPAWWDYDRAGSAPCPTRNSPPPVMDPNNDFDPALTSWIPIGNPVTGTVQVPPVGASAVWRPNARGENLHVIAVLRDRNAIFNDDDVQVDVTLGGFEVKVEMEVIDNTESGNGTKNEILWEYEVGAKSVVWNGLWCSKMAKDWTGLPPVMVGGTDEDNVHIKYTYKVEPDTASLNGGNIRGVLQTSSSTVLKADAEDADLVDGAVTISPGVAVGAPVGFSISCDITTLDNDCAEGVASAAWGFNSTDGLGATQSPAAHRIDLKSSTFGDTVPAYGCLYLLEGEDDDFDPPLPVPNGAADFVSHLASQPESYDTGSTMIGKIHGGEVQAQWTGFAKAVTEGGGHGAYARARLENWTVTAKINDVYYAP